MTDFSRTYNFTAKDALPSGDVNKKIKGSEVDTEFDNVATAVATKANKVTSPTTNNLLKQSALGDLTNAESISDDGTTVTIAATKSLNIATQGNLKVAGVAITATPAEINLLSGKTGTVWTSANDGSGSGLDADLLDGVQSTSFLRSDASDQVTTGNTLTINSGATLNVAGTLQKGGVTINATATEINLLSGKTGTIWTSTNDGASSGLDADLLDGQHLSYFVNASNLSAGTVPSARLDIATLSDLQSGASSTKVTPPSVISNYVGRMIMSSGNGVSGTSIGSATAFSAVSGGFGLRGIRLTGRIRPVNNSVTLLMRFSIDGSSFSSASNYRYTGITITESTSAVSGFGSGGTNQSSFTLATGVFNAVGYYVYFDITIPFHGNADGYKAYTGTAQKNNSEASTIAGRYGTGDDITGFQMYFSSGNVDDADYTVTAIVD